MLDDIAVYVNLFDERRRWRLDLDNTDERLMDAAEELFASKGYDGVTVREIIKAADVKNIGAISYYFGGKRELYFAILRRHFRKVHRLAEIINREQHSPLEKLNSIFRAVREMDPEQRKEALRSLGRAFSASKDTIADNYDETLQRIMNSIREKWNRINRKKVTE